MAQSRSSSSGSIGTTAVDHATSEDLIPPSWMNRERTRLLTPRQQQRVQSNGKCVVYWMQRDVRTSENWAFLYANALAKRHHVPLWVLYCMPPPPPALPDDQKSRHGGTVEEEDEDLPPKVMYDIPMTDRFGSFLLGGLEKVHEDLTAVDVPLKILLPPSQGDVGSEACDWFDQCQPKVVVCDFSPLRQFREWMEDQTASRLKARCGESGCSGIPMVQVDAHNVIPIWHASPKREVGARTLRTKINKLAPTFLTDYPKTSAGNENGAVVDGEDEVVRVGNDHVNKKPKLEAFDMALCSTFLSMDTSVSPVDWAQPGTENGMKQFDFFLSNGLKKFEELRNDPNFGKTVLSNMSPWINHGHVSFQTLARKAKKLNKYANSTASYIEEGLVRRELSDNFVYYARDSYDSLQGAAQWAQDTLQVHSTDKREWLYNLRELETSQTHDDLWNASQQQLVQEGKLHGFLRMYWAKKILEWTESPNVALRTAQYFNDKYALDGNDPNGFVGVGWSIMGIHDMGWKERPIFGKIRFMNYAGCKRKFDVSDFVQKYPGAREAAIQAGKRFGKEPDVSRFQPNNTKGGRSKTAKLTEMFGKVKSTSGTKKRKSPPK